MRYLLTLHVMVNNKKITAIKDVRGATGMGLAQAKNFCESFIPNTMDSYGGMLICNGEQVARLTELDINSRRAGLNEPTYSITSIKRLEGHNALDITALTPYNY